MKELINRAKNLKPLLNNIAQIMLESVRKNFENEGRADKWAALKNSTIKQRQKKGYWPGKILQRSGMLKRSVQAFSDETAAIVSTNIKYAGIHNFGGAIKQATRSSLRTKKQIKEKTIKIPKREFMKLTERESEKIKLAITKYFTEA